MDNVRPFLKAFLLLFLCTTFISLFSFSGGKAIETYFLKQKQFPQGTFIGSIPISDLTIDEAEDKIITHIEKWKNGTSYKLVYFDELVEIPAREVQFFVNESLQMIDQGHGDLKNTISEDVLLEAIEQFSYHIAHDDIQIEGIQSVINFHAANLSNTPMYINVNEYVENPFDIDEVAKTTISEIESTLLLDQWAKNLNGTLIEAREQFSLIQAMKDSGSVIVEAESLNVLATALYETFLQTNFQVRERHIGSTLPDYAKLGFQAVVIPGKIDFIVENSNYQPYTLLVSYEDNALTVALEGTTFPYHYAAVTKNERVIEPRKIVHFSKELNRGDKKIIKNGENGYFVEVYHQKRSKNTNELMSEQLLFEDFYPPVHLVEVRSVQDKPSNGQTGDSPLPSEETGEDPATLPNGENRNERKEDDEEAAEEEAEEPLETDEDHEVDDEDDVEEPIKGY